MIRFRPVLVGTFLALVCGVSAAQSAAKSGVWHEVDRLSLTHSQRRLASDGERVLLTSDSAGTASDDAYVIRRQGGLWIPEQTFASVAPDDWDAGAIDGARLALAHDASFGKVDVFELGSGGWSPTQTIVDPTPGGGFGRGIDLEGDLLVVGDAHATQQSAVHVYRRGASGWNRVQSLLGPFANGGDGFGLRVVLSGERLAVGAQDVGRGSVFVYERGPEGFGLPVELKGGPSNQAFGAELALRGDTLLVGDPGCLPPCSNGPFGQVVFYDRVGGTWLETQRILDPLADAENAFGRAVALGPGVACVSTRGLGFSGDPLLHVYHRLGGRWRQTGLLRQPPPTPVGTSGFAVGVAFAEDELLTVSSASFGRGNLHVFAPDIWLARSPRLPASR